MKSPLPALCAALLLPALFPACTKETPRTLSDDKAGPADAADEHGEKKPLGKLAVGANAFEVVQFGNIEAGKEAAFDLVFAAGTALPSTVRGWIGVESGEGSMKAKLGKEDATTLHGHIAVPKSIPAGSKLWIEIEENGATKKGSIASK